MIEVRGHMQAENVAKVVGTTSSEGFPVREVWANATTKQRDSCRNRRRNIYDDDRNVFSPLECLLYSCHL